LDACEMQVAGSGHESPTGQHPTGSWQEQGGRESVQAHELQAAGLQRGGELLPLQHGNGRAAAREELRHRLIQVCQALLCILRGQRICRG